MEILLADDDAAFRALLAARVGEAFDEAAVLEAEDGAHAVELGLKRRPRLALLDVQMPRLGGFAAAITLRELQPQLRIALQTADPELHRDRAREHGLPLFDKLQLDRMLGWLAAQARSPEPAPAVLLECAVCGYGAARRQPPERCPMCQGERTWVRGRTRRPGRSRVAV